MGNLFFFSELRITSELRFSEMEKINSFIIIYLTSAYTALGFLRRKREKVPLLENLIIRRFEHTNYYSYCIGVVKPSNLPAKRFYYIYFTEPRKE